MPGCRYYQDPSAPKTLDLISQIEVDLQKQRDLKEAEAEMMLNAQKSIDAAAGPVLHPTIAVNFEKAAEAHARKTLDAAAGLPPVTTGHVEAVKGVVHPRHYNVHPSGI